MIQLKKLPADLRRGRRSRFLSEPLEPRWLLSGDFAYVQIYSPLETTSGSNAIMVAPGQSVTFNVSVTGEALGGAGGPTPTGTVNLFETNTAGTVNQHATATLVAQPNDVNGNGLATASATFTMADPNSTAPGYVPFVYADYLGDANYDETLSAGSPPSNDGNVGNTVTVNFTAPANKLAFIQNPSNTAAGDTIQPPVTVAVEDSSGNIQTTATDSITLSLASSSTGTGTGTLAGTATEAAVGGTATFSNLSVNTAGNYALTATDATNTGNTTATSSSFDVTAGKLVFLAPLATTQDAGKPLQPAIRVELEDGSGNPITSEDGTVVTLSPIGTTAANPITGNTAPLSGGIATFNDVELTKPGTYQLQASDPDGDAMGTSNKFAVTGGTLTLTITSRSAHKATGVQTGDVVFYDLNVTSKKPIESSAITDTLPAGFTPLSISAGGTFANDVITWNTTDHDVSFDYVVPGASALANLNAIVTTAAATATYTDSTTDDATATDTVKIAGSLKVTGKLHDVQFQYPAKLSLAEPALGGVPVELVDPSDGTVVDQQKTAADGSFTLTAKLAGTYQVVFTPVVQTYASASNGYSSSTAYVGQSVTIPKGQTTPIELGDLYLPKTFFTTASTVLNSLNNYTTSGFQGLAAFKLDLLQFDTSEPEGVVNALLGTSGSPTPLMNEKSIHIGGPTDPWVAAMRSIAACAAIDQRFLDTFRLADQAGKAVAVLASATVARGLGKSLGQLNQNATLGSAVSNSLGSGFRLASVSNANAKLASATRIAAFTALGVFLTPVLDGLGVTPSDKATLLGVLYNVARYASDLMTGNLISDLGFEAVFNLARIATDAAVLETLTGAQLRPDLPAPYAQLASVLNFVSPDALTGAGFQSAITLTGGLTYNTNTDTAQVLSALDKYNTAEAHAVALTQAATASVNTVAGLFNAIEPVLKLQDVSTEISRLPLTGFQAMLQSVLTSAQSAIAKASGGGAASKVGTQVTETALAVAGAGLIEQSIATSFIPNLAANSVLVGTSLARPDAVVQQPTTVAPAAAPAAVADAAATASDATAYLADLTQLSTLVKKGDTADIPAAFTTFTGDDQALFDGDLVPLDQQAQAVVSSVPTADRAVLARFDEEVNGAINATLLANLQLSAWSASPATGKASAVTAQFAAAVTAVKLAARDAALVRAALTGQTVPATLALDETSVPAQAAVGSTQAFTLTVTNIGSQPTVAGTVTFTNDDGALAVQGGAQQALPALAAGASASVTFTILVSTPTNGDATTAFQVLATAGSVTTQLTDTVTLG